PSGRAPGPQAGRARHRPRGQRARRRGPQDGLSRAAEVGRRGLPALQGCERPLGQGASHLRGRARWTQQRTAEPRRRRSAGSGGRRAAERRAVEMSVEPPRPLPDRLAEHAEQIHFVERVEPSGDHAEERDSIRLVARFQLGDEDAFRLLYQRYFDRVYAYLRIALADARRAEQATKDTFRAAHDSLAGFAAA